MEVGRAKYELNSVSPHRTTVARKACSNESAIYTDKTRLTEENQTENPALGYKT